MKEIKLTQGQIALVDDADFERISRFNWYSYKKKGTKTYYAYRNTLKGEVEKRTVISMHREVLGICDKKTFLDHKDRNGLNNQKSNLRIATVSENGANRPTSSKKNKYIGIYSVNNGRQYSATICKNRKSKYLGCFKTQEEAALAYNEAAKIIHGEFAYLNDVVL